MLVIPTPESIYRGNYASLPAATLKPPVEGNRTVPIEINWLNNGLAPQYTVHFNARQQQTLPISQIAALHIDNSNASSSMHVAFPDTQFEVIVGPNTVGFYPVVTNSLEFWAWIDKTPLAQDKTVIQVLNFLPPPIFFSTQPGGTGVGTVREVDTVAPLQGGPITDIGTVSLATPLAINFGGTGGTTPGGALDNLSGASGAVAGTLVRAAGTPGVWSVAAGLSSPISVANGGTGLTTLSPGNRSLVSNGTGAVIVSPIMTDNGTTISVSTNQVIGTATPGAPSPGLTINAAASAPLVAVPAGTTLAVIGDAANETQIIADAYGTAANPIFFGRHARGTAAAPTALQAGDTLAQLAGSGRGATSYSTQRANLTLMADENWSDTAQGTQIAFTNTQAGTITPATVGIWRQGLTLGQFFADPGPGGLILNQNTTAPLHPRTGDALYIIGADGTTANLAADSYGVAGAGAIFHRRARGTAAAPTAVQANDVLGTFGAFGYGATNWGAYNNIQYVAHQNFTDTAQGTALAFLTTPDGATAQVASLTLQGNVATFSGSVTLGGNYLYLAGGSGAVNATGGPLLYGDSANVILKMGSVNNSVAVQNYGGTTVLTCTSGGQLTLNYGYTTKAGTVGATTGNAFNISWGASGPAHLWIDNVDEGSINVTPCDMRLKKNLATPSIDALAAINAIALKQFDWLENDLRPEHHEDIGFTAQQLADCIPDAVTIPDDPDQMLSVQLTPIVAHLIGAVQQLSAELSALKAKVGA